MKLVRAFFFVSLTISPALSEAATVFSDNFNSYGVAYNWSGAGGWSVTDGTVDLIGPGYFDLLPGNGSYVDLDGSKYGTGLTKDAGFLSHAVNLIGGISYDLSFDLAGSQRSFRGPNEEVSVTFGTTTAMYNISAANYFSNYILSFTPTSSGSYNIIFKNSGGDEIGALLDNVSVDSVSQPSAVPVPAALPLMLTGLGVLGFVARRRKETA